MTMARTLTTIAICVVLSILTNVGQTHKFRAPVLDVSDQGYTGQIREDQRKVTILPEIRIVKGSGSVCSYELVSDGNSSVPYVVKLLDEDTGAAEMLLSDDANLQCDQHKLTFTLVARPCETERSPSESVSIVVTVQDTNDHQPEFQEPWYTVTVDESRLYDNMIQLTAVDADCTPRFSEICRYEITNSGLEMPFTITQQGIVRNTAPLNYTESKSHIISVVAHDCGMRKSKPTLLTVKVREACDLALKHVTDRVDYYPGMGDKLLAADLGLSLCDADCDVKQAEAKVTLNAAHVARGCDRESFSSNDQRKTCHMNSATIDLLPQPDHPAKKQVKEGQNDVLDVHTDKEYYLFDGSKNAVIVSQDVVSAAMPHKFTLSFWMRHDKPAKHGAHKKENILCTSDDHVMSRHHFSVYIRNCKLEMLMRTEPQDVQPAASADDRFRPAEWRWTTPHVCDNNWHHYTIYFDNWNVSLLINGRQFLDRDGNPEILDDVPLHRSNDIKPRMTVGACWHARTERMAQHLLGYLSNVLYLPGYIEQSEVFQCLHQCKEQLQFDGLDSLVPDQQAVFNNDMSELVVSSPSMSGVQQLLQKVAYVNSRHSPTPGRRGFKIEATVTCKDKKEPIHFTPFAGYINVQEAPEPSLVLSSTGAMSVSQSAVKEGVFMLPHLKLKVTQPGADGQTHDTTAKHKLDWCSVHLQPARKVEESEYFSSPASLISQLRLDFEHDNQGIMLKGIESVQGYESVLTQVHYYNLKPDTYQTRKYTVMCSMLNGRVMSNELSVEMSINEDQVPVPASVVQAASNQPNPVMQAVQEQKQKTHNYRLESVLEMDLPGPKSVLSNEGYTGATGSVAGGALALVVVVCVGFLLVMLVVGVMRMRHPRTTRRYRKSTEGDLTWDDGALNITVNPLNGEQGEAAPTNQYSDEDSSDEGEGFHEGEDLSDDDDLSEDNDEVLPHVSTNKTHGGNALEWDDIDSAVQHAPSCTRTYRV